MRVELITDFVLIAHVLKGTVILLAKEQVSYSVAPDSATKIKKEWRKTKLYT